MSTYALLMAKAMRKYICENFHGAETANIQPSESFPIYGMCPVEMCNGCSLNVQVICNITMQNMVYINQNVKYLINLCIHCTGLQIAVVHNVYATLVVGQHIHIISTGTHHQQQNKPTTTTLECNYYCCNYIVLWIYNVFKPGARRPLAGTCLVS